MTDKEKKQGHHSNTRGSHAIGNNKHHSNNHSASNLNSHGIEEKGDYKDHLAVDVDSLIKPQRQDCRGDSRLHSRSHSPDADQVREKERERENVEDCPSDRRSESESNDSNDTPWDHSLVIAEPDVQVCSSYPVVEVICLMDSKSVIFSDGSYYVRRSYYVYHWVSLLFSL